MSLTVLSVGYPLAKVSPATAGGAEQVLLTIDKALVAAGHHSLVLAPEGSRCHGLLIPAAIPAGVLDESAKADSRRIFKRLLDRTLSRFSVDVIHMHGLDFIEYLPDADVPVVVSLHLPLTWYPPRAFAALGSRPTLIAVSEFQARTATPEARIDSVIPNGVDLNEFRPAHRRGQYLLCLGRICPEKAPHLALQAAEQAGAELVLAGAVFDYPEHREYFDRFIAPRLNHRLRFIGEVGGRHKRDLLAGARCLLIPSQAPETSSLGAMEALACGTPVIAWRSGALPEIVRCGRTGFLVSSPEEMSDAISRLDTIDSAACRAEAEAKFDARHMISRYLALFASVAHKPLPELQAA